MKTLFEEAVDAALFDKNLEVSHVQDVTDIFVAAAEKAAKAALGMPEIMHDSLATVSPEAAANILAALMRDLYDFETGALNERGKLAALRIGQIFDPTEAVAFRNFAQLVEKNAG